MRRFIIVLATCLVAGSAWAQQFCNLSFQACPGTLASGVITVPKEAIWLDPKLPFCNEQVNIQNTVGKPPSIVFIIDHSGSMDDNDPTNARFREVRNMIDSLFVWQPKTQVGLVVFTRRLAFDDRDPHYLAPAFPGTGQHDAYVPLTRLDSAFANGVLARDTLKAMLATTGGGGNLRHQTSQLNSRPNGLIAAGDVRNGTDITLGFQGAAAAMQKSTNAPDNRFFFLLSDGLPTVPPYGRPDSTANYLDTGRQDIAWNFRDNVVGVPTTFTIYFDGTAPVQAPGTLDTMTQRIKVNGYSANNPKSTLQAIGLGNQLAPLLASQLYEVTNRSEAATPQTAVMQKGQQPPITNVSKDAASFVFPGRIPLDSGDTKIALTYNYTYKDSTGATKDTSFTYNLTVRRSGAAQSYPPGAQAISCYESPAITLYSNGQPISVVTADHDSVQVRVTLPGGETCNNCPAVVTPSKSNDRETVVLGPGSGYVAGILHRATSNAPLPGNGVLEHLPSDSIVVTFTNPDNPLEVVRKAFPYNDTRSTLTTGPVQGNLKENPSPVVLPVPANTNWTVISNPSVVLESSSKRGVWETVDPNHPAARGDSSLPYPGIRIEASRSFSADVWVFTNFGDLVDKFSFNIPQSEFTKLPPGAKQNTRVLNIKWMGKSKDGRDAGTGAYIVKYEVSLNRLPGVAEDRKITSDVKRLGYLRPTGG